MWLSDNMHLKNEHTVYAAVHERGMLERTPLIKITKMSSPVICLKILKGFLKKLTLLTITKTKIIQEYTYQISNIMSLYNELY